VGREINEKYIRTLFKSGKEIKDGFESRTAQIVSSINELETDIIYSTSIPSTDYSSPYTESSNINDSTFNSVIRMEKHNKRKALYKELEIIRRQKDNADAIMSLYRSLQTHIPVHYEMTNQVMIKAEEYESLRIDYKRSPATIKEMVDITITLVCKLFNDGYTAAQIDEMTTEEFVSTVGEELYIKIMKRETRESNR